MQKNLWLQTKHNALFTRPARKSILIAAILCLLILPACLSAESTEPEPQGVHLVKNEQGWALIRNGENYFIKGGGGHQHLQELIDAGGNSVRTWGADNAGDLLDRAHELGITVTVGIWLGHERHGFNYNDEAAVAQQLEQVGRFVNQYKDHPALLMWSLGNEAEGNGSNPKIWQAFNEAAKLTKQIDPNHPTMTVIAEIGGVKLTNFQTYCPDIDILGVNSYGGFPSLGQRLKDAGFDKPFVVTEFGPLGQWEVGKAPWEAPYEQTSSEKARFCAEGYANTIAAQPGFCLGGYVFNWGNKQEVTPTWYSLFLPESHDATETVDVMAHAWTGHWPDNRAPAIRDLNLHANPNELKANQTYRAQATLTDPNGDELDIRWVVQSESSDRQSGGDFESTPPTHPDLVLATQGSSVEFRAPAEPGAYRLFIYAHDGKGKAATGNIPFYVKP